MPFEIPILFITEGTIEEKIDTMLEAKARLADEVVTAGGEGWITELDNEELLDLFRLGLSAEVEDEDER